MENEKVKCSFSSISGCSLVQGMFVSIHRWIYECISYYAFRNLTEKVEAPLIDKKEKRMAQLRSPKPASATDAHENQQEEVRATSRSDELRALMTGLDSAMGGLKKK